MFFVFDTHDEEEMFYYLYERYNRLLYKYARDILSDESDIEDVLQTSWLKISRNIKKIMNSDEPQKIVFLRKVTKNTAIDVLKMNAKNAFSDLDIETADKNDSGVDCFKYIQFNEMSRAVRNLDDKYKEPLLLKAVYGFDMKEISSILGISEENVGVRIFRAREKVRKFISKGGDLSD